MVLLSAPGESAQVVEQSSWNRKVVGSILALPGSYSWEAFDPPCVQCDCRGEFGG